jgi:hypothetical protein
MGMLDDIKNLGYKSEVAQQFPRVWFHNGIKAATTHGEWYTSERELNGLTTAKPWVAKEKFDGEDGYVASSFRFAPIMTRSQAFMTNDAQETIWLKHYTKGARIYTEYLCIVESITTQAGAYVPVVFATKGLVGKAVANNIKDFRKASTKVDLNAMPPWAFFIPMAAPVNDKGKPVYTDTGRGAFVTLPTLTLPDTFDMEAYYVGPDILAQGDEFYKANREWSKQQRGNEPREANATDLETPEDDTPLAF